VHREFEFDHRPLLHGLGAGRDQGFDLVFHLGDLLAAKSLQGRADFLEQHVGEGEGEKSGQKGKGHEDADAAKVLSDFVVHRCPPVTCWIHSGASARVQALFFPRPRGSQV